MKYEPLLDEGFKEETLEKNQLKLQEKIEKISKDYGNYDVYHSSNFVSKIFFCWVNKVLFVLFKFYLKNKNRWIRI